MFCTALSSAAEKTKVSWGRIRDTRRSFRRGMRLADKIYLLACLAGRLVSVVGVVFVSSLDVVEGHTAGSFKDMKFKPISS